MQPKSTKLRRVKGILPQVALAALLLLTQTSRAQTGTPLRMTPLLLSVHEAPIPFQGSDGRVHLVYELWMTNFSSGSAALEHVDVLGDGRVLQSLDKAAVAQRLQPAGERTTAGSLPKGSQALLFLNLALAPDTSIPHELNHRIRARFAAAPPGSQDLTETGGSTIVDRHRVVIIGPPLKGTGFVSADSCCDAIRHTRAALPVNGSVYLAQRYAVDWEQLDSNHRIYSGPADKLESYAIFGKPVLAVADAVVDSVVTGEHEQTPGNYPTNLPISKADGNAIILDLGAHCYALYAHMQSQSIHLKPGDKVKRGQIIGLVGDTGNSLAPHLHFQVMSSGSSLASSGLPYEIDAFTVTGKTLGTQAFDEAEAKGTPLEIIPVSPPASINDALPLDQLIVSFP